MLHRLAFAVVLAALSSVVHAAATLAGIDLGHHAYGPQITRDDLKGKVILYRYWEGETPNSLTSIAHLVELQNKYGSDNFLVIANHWSMKPSPYVIGRWTANGGTDKIAVIVQGQLTGGVINGALLCYLFDHEGKMLFEGLPEDVDGVLKDAMKATPGAIAAGRTYRKFGAQAAALGALKGNLTGALRPLRAARDGKDEKAAEEAGFLLTRVETFTATKLERIKADRLEDPQVAIEQLVHMNDLFKGDELGKPFEALFKELKDDKAFQTDLKASAILDAIAAQGIKIGLGGSPEAKSHKGVAQIIADLETLKKQFPNTSASRKAEDLPKQWGF
jgi:hypothetical protein